MVPVLFYTVLAEAWDWNLVWDTILLKMLRLYSTIGYQQNLAIQYYSSTSGGTDKTSFLFNRTSVLLGANYKMKFSEENKLGLIIGGGGSFNIPGKMTVTELNFRYGEATFHPEIGFHLEAGLFYEFSKWIIIPSIRYRYVYFRLKDYNKLSANTSFNTVNYMQFSDYIKNVNACGVDLSITLRRKSGNNKPGM